MAFDHCNRRGSERVPGVGFRLEILTLGAAGEITQAKLVEEASQPLTSTGSKL